MLVGQQNPFPAFWGMDPPCILRSKLREGLTLPRCFCETGESVWDRYKSFLGVSGIKSTFNCFSHSMHCHDNHAGKITTWFRSSGEPNLQNTYILHTNSESTWRLRKWFWEEHCLSSLSQHLKPPFLNFISSFYYFIARGHLQNRGGSQQMRYRWWLVCSRRVTGKGPSSKSALWFCVWTTD